MTQKKRTPSPYQRNALAPSLLAAAVLFLAPVLLDGNWSVVVLFVTSIMALIIAWFALTARQWWWMPIFLAIAVIWNPVFPFPFTGPIWIGVQPAVAVVFLVAGGLIKIRRPS
ncbi:hypothetical protein JF531_07585 [Microbacterium esteraromaticum]|uniref:DUF6804 family protein n=1 Tax=Microbacterium esteraromaticum TaxID=57043 RepID=UPI001A8E63EF|nr:hypothetical protein [Microbacterium esteraromaticum]